MVAYYFCSYLKAGAHLMKKILLPHINMQHMNIRIATMF